MEHDKLGKEGNEILGATVGVQSDPLFWGISVLEFRNRFKFESIEVWFPHCAVLSSGLVIRRINNGVQAVLINKVTAPHKVTEVNFLV